MDAISTAASIASEVNETVLGLSPLVIDLIAVCIILAVALLYAKRGIYQTAAIVLVIVLAFVIGLTVSEMAKDSVTDLIWDKYGSSVEEKFDAKVDSIVNGTFNFSEEVKNGWNNFIKSTGIESLDVLLAKEAEEDIDYTDSALVANLKAYTLIKSKIFLNKWVHAVLFGLITAVALFMLTFIKNMIGELTKLPVIKWVDKLGGFAVGAALIIIILIVITRVCGLIGIDFFNNISQGTVVTKWICTGDLSDAAEYLQTLDIEQLKNIDFNQAIQQAVDSYDIPELTSGTENIAEFVKNVDVDTLEDIISKIANNVQ